MKHALAQKKHVHGNGLHFIPVRFLRLFEMGKLCVNCLISTGKRPSRPTFRCTASKGNQIFVTVRLGSVPRTCDVR